MSRKTYLIIALALLAFSSAAVWLNAHDESAAEALMKKAAAAWELDTGRYKSVGIEPIFLSYPAQNHASACSIKVFVEFEETPNG